MFLVPFVFPGYLQCIDGQIAKQTFGSDRDCEPTPAFFRPYFVPVDEAVFFKLHMVKNDMNI